MTTTPTIKKKVRHAAAALALGIAAMTTGCTAGYAAPPPNSGKTAPKPAPNDPQSPPAPESGGLQAEANAAVAAADGFWEIHWEEYFTGEYTPPRVVGFYQGANGPACGGEPSEPMNAFYCSEGDFLAWDEGLMSEGWREGESDAFVTYVIMHEYGHAIQARLDPSLSARAPELQADCLAAATMYGAAKDGTLIFEPGDENELAEALAFVGDDTPWTNAEDHGTAIERLEAFSIGRNGGVLACFPETSSAE